MSTLEIEVKFFLEDLEGTRRHLERTGATSGGRNFERNICLENASGELSKSESLLRLRKDQKNTLTYKTRPPVVDRDFKVLTEREVEVGDFEAMLDILQAIGFFPSLVYEKYRETFRLGSATVCLDRMPFGDFMEIEGNRDEILKIVGQLGLHWPRRILLNYRAMFSVIKGAMNLPFTDITFDNFDGLQVGVQRFLPKFEAGTRQEP